MLIASSNGRPNLSTELIRYLIYGEEEREECVCGGDLAVECSAHLVYETGLYTTGLELLSKLSSDRHPI